MRLGTEWHVMAARLGEFGRKQEEAIAALLTQRNVEEAAREARIGTRTLLRWLQIPEFQKAYSAGWRRPGYSPKSISAASMATRTSGPWQQSLVGKFVS